MTKRIVLSGYFGFKNFGDEAILSVLVNKLQKDKHSLTIITSNPQYTHNIHKHVKCIKTFDITNIIGAIAKSDILISGGGSLLQDVTSLKSLLYYLTIIFIGLFLNKKVIIFAQGIGPINSILGQIITKILLKHCSYVSVRDEKSYQLLKSWNINADLLCDPVFSADIPDKSKTNTVAIQLRNFKTMNKDFIDRLADATNKNFNDKNIEIYSFQDEIDTKICEEFENNLKMLNPDIKTSLYKNLSNDEITHKLSKCEYLIAMRFHAIIIGLLAGSKILAINYDTKVEKIANEFNLPIIDLKNDFTDKFETLKKQKVKTINKNFNWENFDKIVNNT